MASYIAGPYTVASSTGDLGTVTPEGFKIDEEKFYEPIKPDQYGGNTMVDAIYLGKTCKVSWTFQEWNATVKNLLFPETEGLLGSPGSLSKAGHSRSVTLTPTSDGVATTVYNFKYLLPTGSISRNNNSKLRLTPFTGEAIMYTSSTTNKFYTTSAFTS